MAQPKDSIPINLKTTESFKSCGDYLKDKAMFTKSGDYLVVYNPLLAGAIAGVSVFSRSIKSDVPLCYRFDDQWYYRMELTPFVCFLWDQHLANADLGPNVAAFAAYFKDWKIWTLATFRLQDFIAIINAYKSYDSTFVSSPYIAVIFYALIRQFIVLYHDLLRHIELPKELLDYRRTPKDYPLGYRLYTETLKIKPDGSKYFEALKAHANAFVAADIASGQKMDIEDLVARGYSGLCRAKFMHEIALIYLIYRIKVEINVTSDWTHASFISSNPRTKQIVNTLVSTPSIISAFADSFPDLEIPWICTLDETAIYAIISRHHPVDREYFILFMETLKPNVLLREDIAVLFPYHNRTHCQNPDHYGAIGWYKTKCSHVEGFQFLFTQHPASVAFLVDVLTPNAIKLLFRYMCISDRVINQAIDEVDRFRLDREQRSNPSASAGGLIETLSSWFNKL